MGLHSVTTGLSIMRLVTVNIPSMMHVSVQAPPLPTQIQAGFDPCHIVQVEGCSSQHAACRGNPLTPSVLAFLFLFVPPSWAYPVFLSSRVDGTETHTALYSIRCVLPIFPLPLQNIHTRQCFESRPMSTPPPWSNPPTKHVAPQVS